MVALTAPHVPSNRTELQDTFLKLLPKIQTHAHITFRHLRCADQRSDRLAETVALAWKWFLRLQEMGKDIHQFPVVFAYLVVKAVRCGRRLAGQERLRDILSQVAQVRNDFLVETMPQEMELETERVPGLHGTMRRVVRDGLQANTHTSIPEQVAFRMDWPEFFSSLPERDQQMVEFLAVGHRAEHAALRFGVSRSRVSQLRKQWQRQWRAFQEEELSAKRFSA